MNILATNRHNSGARIRHNKIINNHIPEFSTTSGGGVSGFPNGSTAHVIIDNNQIVNNTITGGIARGAGIQLLCNGTIKNNDIFFNTSNATGEALGAVTCWSEYSSNVDLINNQIKYNIANGGDLAVGGGIHLSDEMAVLVIGNEISYNELYADSSSGKAIGGGIHVWSLPEANIIDRNTISNNKLFGFEELGGGIYLHNSNPMITNNILSGNSAIYGGGIYNHFGKAQIINNTIVYNSATVGGGLRNDGSQTVILNTIIWGNGPGDQIKGSADVAYSDIEGEVWDGEGNISVDPFFKESLYNLSDTSACVGTGTDSIQIAGNWYYAPPFDFYGHTRPNRVDEYVDIGAIESKFRWYPPSSIDQSSQSIPLKFALQQNYPNPFNPITNIKFSIPKAEFVTLKVYNLLGQQVATLVSEQLRMGNYNYTWDASGHASGIYLFKLQAGEFVKIRKMVLLR